ncbi:MAG: hypothetical protein GEU73_14265 [Chloroflexi bacterium]|nr:hypothetical protein [Chloroflexota bacterium]
MRAARHRAVVGLVAVLFLAACAAPQAPGAAQADRSGTATSSAPKRLTAALTGDPPTFSYRFNPGGVVPGIDRLEEFLNSGLTVEDDQGLRRAQLAEGVPTVENGLWKLFPDGRMETTWTITSGATWHDGAPLTTDDLLFAAEVEQDREMPLVRSIAFDSVDRIEVTDARTLTIQWSRPFIWADAAFSGPAGVGFAFPLPQHLLQRPYAENKAGFLDLPYWTHEFVGTGPYQVKEFVPASHIILTANDRYALGRPRIDEIELKIIPDWETLAANVLAGEVEVTPGGRITLEWAAQVRDQWRDGHMEVAVSATQGWFALFPQFLTPNPPIVTNLQFRRALVHAIDRQQLADNLMGSAVPPALSAIAPSDPEYRAIEGNIVRYDFDPRRAMEMIENLGYSRGPDGLFRDAGGQQLSVEVRTIVAETQQKLMLSTVDFWKQAGINAEPATIPLQLARDSEQYATHPGFLIVRNPAHVRGLSGLHSSRSPVPENRFTGNNYGRYKSEEFDRLLDTLFVTIPMQEEMQILGQIVRHMTENLNVIGLVFNPDPILVSNRVQNVPVRRPTWNTHEWDVR